MNICHLQRKFEIIKIFTIIIFTIISVISCSYDEDQEIYNFVDKQNYEIDLNYDQIKGNNLYFHSDDDLSLFLVTIYPYLNLMIDMKLYTNNTEIISAIDNYNSLMFGFDFNFTNLDVVFPYYRSDIFVCYFSKNMSQCSDYIFDITDNKYKNNEDGKIMKSNIQI